MWHGPGVTLSIVEDPKVWMDVVRPNLSCGVNYFNANIILLS